MNISGLDNGPNNKHTEPGRTVHFSCNQVKVLTLDSLEDALIYLQLKHPKTKSWELSKTPIKNPN